MGQGAAEGVADSYGRALPGAMGKAASGGMNRERRITNWQRMCLGKKRMPESIARKIATKWGQRAYFCPHCSGWHCTKQPPWQNEKPSPKGAP